jgi:DNA-binding MarR family transcriptional regulator
MSNQTETAGMGARAELAREIRQFQELSASLSRAEAARAGIPFTDKQVLDFLAGDGPSTAGHLAELTGLTTGAVTGMLNRLEESGAITRERDAADGRRVIVRLAPGAGSGRPDDARGGAWGEVADDYDESQAAVLVAFVKRCNALARARIAQMRETDSGESGVHAAPRSGVSVGQLNVDAAGIALRLHSDSELLSLFKAHFQGPMPELKVDVGNVAIRYPHRLLLLPGRKRAADVTLSGAVPWRISIRGNASSIAADLAHLDLTELEVEGGSSEIRLELPAPARVVPVKISGAASAVTITRPAGVAARVRLRGRSSALQFDGQQYVSLGGDQWLQSREYDFDAPSYQFDLRGAVSQLTIETVG